MAYEKQNFENNQVLNASHLNHIEDGIESVEQSITLENIVKYENIVIVKEAEELASVLDYGTYYIDGDLFLDAHKKNTVIKFIIDNIEYEFSFEDAEFHDSTAEMGAFYHDYFFGIYNDKLSTINISYIDAPEYDMPSMSTISVSKANWEDAVITRLEVRKNDYLAKVQKEMIENVDHSTIVNKPTVYTKLEDNTNMPLPFVDYLRLYFKNLIDRRTVEVNATPYENSQGRNNELELSANNYLDFSAGNGIRIYNMERNGMENAKGIKFTITQDIVDNVGTGNLAFVCTYNTVNFPVAIRLVCPNGNYVDGVIPFTRAHGQASETGVYANYFDLYLDDYSYTPYLQAGDYYILFAVTENDMDYDNAFVDLSNIIVYIDSYSNRTEKAYTMKDIDKLLERDNIDPYVPVGDYNPATKQYVDTLVNSKSDKLIYTDTEKIGGLTFTKEQMTLAASAEQLGMSTLAYNIEQLLPINIGTTYNVTLEFNDGTSESFASQSVSMPLPSGESVIGLQIVKTTSGGSMPEAIIMVVRSAKYTNSSEEMIPTYDPNCSAIVFMHQKADIFKSFNINVPSQFEINNEFFNEYKFVTENEKNYWDNKANKKDLYYDNREYEEVVYSYDGNRANKETVFAGSSAYFVKVGDFDKQLSREDFNDCDIKLVEYTNGQITDEMWASDQLGKDAMINYIYDVEEVPGAFSIMEYVMLITADVNTSDFPLSKGIWFLDMDAGSGNKLYISDLKISTRISGELKGVEEKYLEAKPGWKTGNYAEVFNTRLNIANGIYSHAEGYMTRAEGIGSHAEGSSAYADGDYSHAEGAAPHAEGYASHAEGWFTYACGEYQHVQGRCNVKDTANKYAHIVGNGSNGTNRSNAHTLDWSGNAWFAGKVTANGTPTAAKDLVTKEYVDALAVNSAIMNIAHMEEIDSLIEENNIYVLDYKYQRVNMFNNANIILPEVDTFTKIHLYFDATEDLVINLPDCRKKQLPEILANKSYELVATYNMNYWLVEINVFE